MEDFLILVALLWFNFMGIGLIIVLTYMMWDILKHIFTGEL